MNFSLAHGEKGKKKTMRLQKRQTPHLYAAYYQLGRGYDFPIYRGRQRGGFLGPLGKILGRVAGPIIRPFVKTFLPKVVKTIVPRVKPLATNIAKEVGKKALNESLNQAQDVLSGRKKMKTAMKDLANVVARETRDSTLRKMRGGSMVHPRSKTKRVTKRKQRDIFSRF